MTRDDLSRFFSLNLNFSAIGLEPSSGSDYFCTPVDAEEFARLGVDGIHFILLPGDERVFCVDPEMGEIGTYVLPVAEDFRSFLSYLLSCGDANVLSQIHWMNEEQYQTLLREDREQTWPGCEAVFADKERALQTIAAQFGLSPTDPFRRVKALQKAFDPAALRFSDEYYDVLGLDRD